MSRSYQPSSSDSKSTKENRLVGQVNREMIELDGVKCWALIDSGSVVSSISEGFYTQHCTHIPLQDVESICDLNLVGATGDQIDVLGFIEVEVKLPALCETIPVLLTVFKSSILDRGVPALIGSNVIDE